MSYQLFRNSQPLPQTGMNSHSYVSGQFTGETVQNVFHDPATHLKVMYSANQTPFKSNLTCMDGIPSVNNNCLCTGSTTSVPFRQQPHGFQMMEMNSLFTPMEPWASPTPSALLLVNERGRAPQSYMSMDPQGLLH